MRIATALVFVLLFLACKPDTTREKDPPQYNILWIVADDLGTDLGCYGNTVIHTPNLDQLASQSVRYTNLNSTTAVCSPSRSGLITGMYPVTLDVHQHRTQFKNELPAGVKPITEYFKEAGYFVTNGNGKEDAKGGKTDYNFKYSPSDMYQGVHWRQRPYGTPFFAQIQVFYPHRPFHEDENHPVDPDRVDIPPYYPDHELIRKDWALYLETVQLADKQVGTVLDQLQEDGLLDSTIIFFFGDQGRPHARAKQFLYNAGTNTPLLVRWPDGRGAGTVSDALVSNIDIPVATMHLAGIPMPKNIQGVDFLDSNTQREYLFTMRDRRDETVDRIRSVRNKQFKYTRNYYPDRAYTQYNVYKEMRYPALPLMRMLNEQGKLNPIQQRFISDYRPQEELYDLVNDPFEINNLAANEEYASQREELKKVLEAWVAENDKGMYPEDEKEIEAAYQQAQSRKTKILSDRGLSPAYTDEEMVDFWMKELKLEE